MAAVLQLKARILGRWKLYISCAVSVTRNDEHNFLWVQSHSRVPSPVHQMEMAEEDMLCMSYQAKAAYLRMKPTVKNFSMMLSNGTTAIFSAELEHHVP